MTDQIIYSTEPEDFYYMGVNVPCQNACPAGTNIPAYIRAIFEGQNETSYDINRTANILPAVLGRICSRPCENRCRHGESELGDPVNICYLKRASSDYKEETVLSSITPHKLNGKKVAIIGSGPAGLAAAHDLALGGFSVKVFEAFDNPGGMLRYGIPEFRLPRNVLEAEILYILNLGVELKTGIKLGTDLDLESLKENFDAVLIATGCYKSNRLKIPGETLAGVHSGLEFMIDYCSGKKQKIGSKVLVIGAGFTSFDCARSALRLGAKDVTICLRRTEEDLAVTEDEIHETKTEGIKIETLMLSQAITGNTDVEGVEFLRTRPGNMKPDGKRDIIPIKGSNFTLSADTVIVATGQTSETIQQLEQNDHKNKFTPESDSCSTHFQGIYTAGDYVTGPTTVIEAINTGRKAANDIAENLMGKTINEKVIRMEETQITDRKRAWDFISKQAMPKIMPVEKRFSKTNLEVESGFTMETAQEESKRCYLCYLHYEIDIERCIYCRYCIDAAPRDCIKMVDEVKINKEGAITGFIETSAWGNVNAIVIDNSRCIRCGECVRVCPVDCISVTKVELTERKTDAG